MAIRAGRRMLAAAPRWHVAHRGSYAPPSLWRSTSMIVPHTRALCVAVDDDKYLELKQLKDIKSEAFYDEHNLHRRYFYYIDLQGRLFLENTRPKNIATSLKSAKFLRFFFSQLRPNRVPKTETETQATGPNDQTDSFLEYPYRSPCGKEMNIIKCADRPLVFEDLRRTDPARHDDGASAWEFVFGGGELTMPFRPDALKVSLSTGRLYHDVRTKHFSVGDPLSIGLVRSQLAVELGRTIQLFDDVPGTNDDGVAPVIGEFEWEGVSYAIREIE